MRIYGTFFISLPWPTPIPLIPIKNDFVQSGRQDVMLEMFHKILEYLKSGPEQRRVIKNGWQEQAELQAQKIRNEVKLALDRREVPYAESRLGEYFSMFTPYYFRTNAGNNVIDQFKMFDQTASEVSQPALHVHTLVFSSRTAHGPMFEVSVGANHDAPGMLYKMSGVLAALGFNIWDAKVNTTKEGVVFDRFRGYFLPVDSDYWKELTAFLREFKPFADLPENVELRRNEVLPELIKLVVEGYISIDKIFSFDKSFDSFKRLTALGPQPTRILFENYPGMPHTVLNLKTDDCLGLLYIVSRILSEKFKLNIHGTPTFSTFHKGPEDEFVLTANGRPLNRAEREDIVSSLEHFLDRPRISNDDIIREISSFSDRDWTRAEEVIVKEITSKEETVVELPYYVNQVAVRHAFLVLLKDIKDGKIDDWRVFMDRLKTLHMILITGTKGKSIYVPAVLSTMDKYQEHAEDRQAMEGIAKNMAGQLNENDPYIQKRLEDMFENLKEFVAPEFNQKNNLRNAVLHIGNFYVAFMSGGRHLDPMFEGGNHALAMNMVNAMLRLKRLNVISNSDLDLQLDRYFGLPGFSEHVFLPEVWEENRADLAMRGDLHKAIDLAQRAQALSNNKVLQIF